MNNGGSSRIGRQVSIADGGPIREKEPIANQALTSMMVRMSKPIGANPTDHVYSGQYILRHGSGRSNPERINGFRIGRCKTKVRTLDRLYLGSI